LAPFRISDLVLSMSKQPSGRRPNQPIVPAVSPQTWRELLAAADQFNALAPWTWMHDSQVIGMRHRATNEVLLGSILGRLRSVFALIVYRNAAGHRWLLNAILGEADSAEDDDRAFDQDAIKAEFVLKRELEKEDRAILTAASFSPSLKGTRVWPQFRSMAPGAFPWHVTQNEAETLLFALPRAAALAKLVREKPDLWDDHRDGEIAFLPANFDPAKDELRPRQLDWEPMIPVPEPIPEAVTLDDATTARLLGLRQAKGFHLEIDVTYSPPIVVADVDRPRLPKLALAVDRGSGFIGGFHLSDPKDREGVAALGSVLCNALTKLGARPEVIFVQRLRVAAMLAPIADRLGIPVIQDLELEELSMAKENIEAFLRRR
jgi:hypothetical protein